jgi:hypothetical protein
LVERDGLDAQAKLDRLFGSDLIRVYERPRAQACTQPIIVREHS